MKSQTAADISDAALIAAVRDGDQQAVAALWSRHHAAAYAHARTLTDASEADDLAAEAFMKVVGALQSGVGPSEAFRPYLYTVVRNLAAGEYRRRARIAPDEPDFDLVADTEIGAEEQMARQLDSSTLGRAFRSLPERWQSVLWYLEVEGMRPRQIAAAVGMQAGAVSSLAHRARRALRAAWVQEHLNLTDLPDACRSALSLFGAYDTGILGARDRRRVEAHIRECERCPDVIDEAKGAAARIAFIFLPLISGISAVKVLGGSAAPASAATAIGDTAGAAGGAATVGGKGAAGAASGFSRVAVTTIVAGATVVAIGVAAAIALPQMRGMRTPDTAEAATSPRPHREAAQSQAAAPKAPKAAATVVPSSAPSVAPSSPSALPPSISAVTTSGSKAMPGTTSTPAAAPSAATRTSPPATLPRLATPAPTSSAVTTNSRTPVLSGTSVAGATVTVTLADGATVKTTADAAGAWSVRLQFAADTTTTAQVTATKDGYRSSAPAPVTITVDTAAPAAPIIATTWAAADTSAPVISGTAEPESTVTVTATDGSDATATAAQTSADGSWSVAVPGLRPTDSGVRATAKDPAGNYSEPPTTAAFAFVPTVAAPLDGATYTPTTDNEVPIKTNGWANASVAVFLDGEQLSGALDLDSTGTVTKHLVSTTPAGVAGPLAAGTHTIQVAYVTADGTVSDHRSAVSTFTVND